MAIEANHTGIAKLMTRKKPRWHFSIKKAISPDHVDGDTTRMQRSSSNVSLSSNQSDDVFHLSGDCDLEDSDIDSDIEPLDMEL